MGLTNAQLREHLDAVAADDAIVAAAIERCGYPEERIRSTGYRTLLRTIVGQQVSVASAAAVWNKLEAELGEDMLPQDLLARDFDTLRACGLSRQKQGYARSLCELVASGELAFDNLPEDDEAAMAELTMIKGIGRWSAEIYLLFAEGVRTSGLRATWRYRRPSDACSNCRQDRARRKRVSWGKDGGPIAAQWPSSPGTHIITPRFRRA